MLPFDDALRIVLSSAHRLADERVSLGHAANRILAEDVTSDINIPPFDKSLRDGYTCRKADLANELGVVETIPAGYVPTKRIGPNECAKIMTGGMIPHGADCVLMKEYVEARGKNTVRFVGEWTTDYISRKAEDVTSGEVVLKKGVLLKAHHIAVLASVGHTRPCVAKMPRVGIMATGNELIDPANTPKLSQIRNSNSYQLAAQIHHMNVAVTDYGIAEDTEQAIDRMFKKAIGENDVVLVSGGVSVGDFDYVPTVFRRNDFNLLFEKIAVKPGKPTVFGVSDRLYCFGVPGNPVSTFVQFEILIKPFLYKLMGHEFQCHHVRMPLAESTRRKETERQEWLPVAITGAGTVQPIDYHGSAHINALCNADGLMCIDVGVAEIEKGTDVKMRLI
jgi:molybdopterin molybdotransferase